MKQHIIDFLKFLESKGEKKIPLEAKLQYPDKFSPLTEEDLNIEGSLNLAGINATSLPDNFTVGGTLYLSGSKIISLPDNLKVGGSLYLWNTEIKSLPDNLKVRGNLHLTRTPLAKKMTSEQIRQEIEQKGGYVKGSIYK